MNLGFQAFMVLPSKQSKLSRASENVRKDKETVSATVCEIFNSKSKENCRLCACQLVKFHFAVIVKQSL